jgi:antitoxin component YwqK of YwqJK toxin-antitoxin module
MLATMIIYAALADPAEGDQAKDLRTIAIPGDAREFLRGDTQSGRRTGQHEYSVGTERVGVREFYDNGKLAEERLYRHDKLHGVLRQYHLNGKLFAERPYRDGVMDGEFRFWDEDGELMGSSKIEKGTGFLREYDNPYLNVHETETPYRNNQIHGRQILWGRFLDCEGIGFQISNYVDGQLQGIVVVRHEDGLLLSWSYFKDDHLHGTVTYLNRDGKVVTGYPRYYLRRKKVTAAEFEGAASGDPELAATLKFEPPKYDKVPESPSQAYAKKKAAEKARSATKEK